MKFKSIFFITIILLAIISISAVSAEDGVADENVDTNSSIDSVDTSDVDSSGGETVEDNSTPEVISPMPDNETSEPENESSISSSDVTKYFKNDTQFIATFFDLNGTPIVNQKVPLTINGANYQRTTNESGSIKFNINLFPGSYVINVTNPVTNETASNNVVVLPTMNASDVVKSYKNDTQYYVNVVDGQGNPLSGAKLQLNINGVFYNRTTDSNGVAKMNINLNSGKYLITAENLDNGEKVSNNITVLTTIEGKDVKLYYKNGTQYVANFTDSQGNPLAKTKVQFNINGVFYNRTTDENGTAKIAINLNSGKYVITATNPVTKEMKSNNVEVLNKIIAKNSQSGGNISIEYNNGAKYTVELHNDNGSLAVNKKVKFNINGVFYTRTSNENGTASLPINLLPDNYVITAEFEGCKLSNTLKVRVTPSVKIINTTVKTNDYVQFRLTEKVSGNPITGQHYGIVYFNGTTYGTYPDSTGLCKIRVRLPADNYMFYFGTIDDGWYSSVYVLNTIKVIN